MIDRLVAALREADAVLTIVASRSDKAEYLRALATVRAAIKEYESLAMPTLDDLVKTRFERCYRVDDKTGCWLWIRSFDSSGYGQFSRTGVRFRQAHKWGWVLHRGPVPEGYAVLHKCDVRACVNPEHLFLGVHSDNLADMLRKNRQRRSSSTLASRNGKITKEQAISISNDQRPAKEIAAEYGLNIGAIYKIRDGVTWGWATGKGV
jgi:hypothetical protein